MMCGCFAVGGIGLFHTIKGSTALEHNVNILKQHLQKSVWLKFGATGVLEMENNLNHLPSLDTKWLMDNYVKDYRKLLKVQQSELNQK